MSAITSRGRRPGRKPGQHIGNPAKPSFQAAPLEDLAFFKKNPGREFRVRLAFPDEISLNRADVCLPPDCFVFVVVCFVPPSSCVPDNDDVGLKYISSVAKLSLKAGARTVRVVPVPAHFIEGWDLADDAPEGADLHALLETAEPHRSADEEQPGASPDDQGAQSEPIGGFKMGSKSLTWRDPSDTDAPPVVISGRFEVLAECRDNLGTSWGVLLRWNDPDGKIREWAMPKAVLAGDGVEVRRALLDGGLYVGPGGKARNLLNNYLAGIHTKARARAVSSTGWYDQVFVFPDGAIGARAGDRVILQTPRFVDHAYGVNGSLDGWQAQIGRYAEGNSLICSVRGSSKLQF
jgi:putative DNA primase/helicase